MIFVGLAPELDLGGLEAWLKTITSAVDAFQQPLNLDRVASVAVGFGRSFFFAPGGVRFGLSEELIPRGLSDSRPFAAPDALPTADVAFYAMTTSEAALADFLEALAKTGPSVRSVAIERGYQRAGAGTEQGHARELFGFKDGLRNAPWPGRYDVVFVDRDEGQPEEPSWTEDGTYLAYLKIRQELDRWESVGTEDQERIIGRRKADGSRIDLPEGSNPRDESAPGDPGLPLDSHVRKARTADDVDDVRIFRRGVPYLSLRADGSREGGLQFVSFQATLENFDVVLNRWMLNPDFPQQGAQTDRLMRDSFAIIERSGFFFVPPFHREFIGGGLFESARPDPRPKSEGRLFVRKRAFSGDAPALTNLAGVWFQIFRPDGQPVGDRFRTNSAGHAVSPDLPVREDLILREVDRPANLEPAADVPFQLQKKRQPQEVRNQVKAPGTY